MADPALSILIDSAPAEAGAKKVVSALERIQAEAGKTMQAVAALNKVRLGLDSGGMKSAQAEVAKLQRAIAALNGARANVKISANTTAASRQLNALQSQLSKIQNKTVTVTTKQVTTGSSGGGAGLGIAAAGMSMGKLAGGVAGGLVGGLGLVEIGQQLKDFSVDVVKTNVEFQKLMASLETVTGSSAGAKTAFAEIENFATSTPYTLSQVTEAFIKLKAMGLDPSMDALKSYGNTASAMGKPINQMIEAVADAATGEFERLKEFGIKAKQEGDKVSFTFQGVTRTIGNNARDIEKYLQNIGNINFAGGMERQMQTLAGKFSNLQDAVEKFERQIGQAGLNGALGGLTDELTKVVGGFDGLARVLGGSTGALLDGITQAIRNTRLELEHINRVIDNATGAGRSVTVPVIDKTTEGLKPENLDNMTGTEQKGPVATALPKEFTSKFGDIPSLKMAAEAPMPFLIGGDKPAIKSNVLNFSRPAQEDAEKDRQRSSNRASTKAATKAANSAISFGEDTSALKAQIAAQDALNSAIGKGSAEVLKYRDAQADSKTEQQLLTQYGKAQADQILALTQQARELERVGAFKSQVSDMQEAVTQSDDLAAAYGRGSEAAADAEAKQRALATAIQLGVVNIPGAVEKLTDMEKATAKAAARAELAKEVMGTDIDISGIQALIDAYGRGGDAIDKAADAQAAYSLAVSAGAAGEKDLIDLLAEKLGILRKLRAEQDQQATIRNQGIDIGTAEKILQASNSQYGNKREDSILRAQMEGDITKRGLDPMSKASQDEIANGLKLNQLQRDAANANDELSRMAGIGDDLTLTFRDLAAQGIGKISDSLVDVLDGTKTFKESMADLTKSVGRMFIDMAIQMVVAKTMAMAVGALLPVGGGAVAGAATGMPVSLLAGMAHSGGVIGKDNLPKRKVPAFHTGGIVGQSGGMTRSLPSFNLPMSHLPKYHTGGIVGGNEQPALLKRGEGVFTENQMRALAPAGGGGGMNVTNNINVNQPAGADKEQGQRFGKEIAKQINAAIDSRLIDQQRNGGLLRPGYSR